jgi:hypothetical protein
MQRAMKADVLRKMDRAKRLAAIKKTLLLWIDELLTKDLDLIVSGAHEQSICHRLAVYLERHTDLNVDCEYNRNMMEAKRLAELDGKKEKLFRPDIIAHKRLRNDENALVVETKLRGRNRLSEVERLRKLTEERTQYDYWAGAVIIFFNQRRMLIRDHTLRVTIDWFPQSDQQPPTELQRPIPDGWICRIKEIEYLKRNAKASSRSHTLDPVGT